jgi:hypothetical protein
MTPTPRNFAALSVLLVGFLSACSPNPTVLQDRVYGSRATPAPVNTDRNKTPARVPSVVVSTPTAPAVSNVPLKKPVQTQTPPPIAAPVETVVMPSTPPPAPPEVLAPKVYPSSSAVQALVRTADAEAASGNLDKAADTLERALRIEADNPDLWMKLAKINEQQGKHDQALGMVSKAQAYREQLN